MLIFVSALALFAQEPVVTNERLSMFETCADRLDLTTECAGIEVETALVAPCLEGAATVGAVTGCITQRMTDCMDTDDDGSVDVPLLARWCGARVRAGLSNGVTSGYQRYAARLSETDRAEFRTNFLQYIVSINEVAASGGGDAFQIGGRKTGMLSKLAFDLKTLENEASGG